MDFWKDPYIHNDWRPVFSSSLWEGGFDDEGNYKIAVKNKEEKMSLVQQYLHKQKNENDKVAIEVGAMNDDGTLTCEGKELLLNILLTDPKIREQFDKAIELLKKDKEE